jgi:hypothetical protein
MEQRAVIKFCFKWGKTAMEVYLDLKDVYSDDCLNHAQVYQWFAHFNGRESLEDDAHPGQQVSARSNEKVGKTRAIVTQDRIITTRLLECLGICKEAGRQILEGDWQKKSVPHSLKAKGREQ